jgi:hypothetical protein
MARARRRVSVACTASFISGWPSRLTRVANHAAPYCHPRLQAVDAKVGVATQVEVISQDEKRRQAIEAFDEAFRERPKLEPSDPSPVTDAETAAPALD